MNQWMYNLLQRHQRLREFVREELLHEYPELQNHEALEDYMDYAGVQLQRMAKNPNTAELHFRQGLKRVAERWSYRRAHPEIGYSEAIREIAEGPGPHREEDFEAEPDLRGPQGEAADIVSEAQHERDAGEAIDWLRQRRAGQPGYGREITDEQRERMREGVALQARRRANGA